MFLLKKPSHDRVESFLSRLRGGKVCGPDNARLGAFVVTTRLPDPPLAEVQVAEEERLLEPGERLRRPRAEFLVQSEPSSRLRRWSLSPKRGLFTSMNYAQVEGDLEDSHGQKQGRTNPVRQ